MAPYDTLEGIVNTLAALLALGLLTTTAAAETIQGRWKLLAAEDLRADGSVARYPWGQHPIGSIVVEGGSCYLQIMSSDVPSFAVGTSAVGEQMKAALLSTYIAYSGPCTINEADGSVTLKPEREGPARRAQRHHRTIDVARGANEADTWMATLKESGRGNRRLKTYASKTSYT